MSRSRLLTYWTGRNIERNPNELNDEKRSEYLERLWSILEEGFWMNHIDEEVIGYSEVVSHSSIKMTVPMICLTELRLSQSQEHNTRYGLLGIVVDRQFVLERHGAPVFYVPSNTEETIVWNVVQAIIWLEDQCKRRTTGAEQLLQNLYVPFSYLKSMSTQDTDDHINLEESEWRIVHTYKIQERGLIVQTKKEPPKYKIPLKPGDLKMIVLPDTDVRELVMSDDRITKWFNGKFPPLLTVEEIANF